MTSADFLQFAVTTDFFPSARPPRVSATTVASCICCIYALKFGQYRTSFWYGNSSVSSTPCIQFLFVRPRFCPQEHFSVPTSDFLQIPPLDGHPCLRLTVPTAKSVADFHRQVIAHAERTYKIRHNSFEIYRILAKLSFRVTLKRSSFFYTIENCSNRISPFISFGLRS